MKKRRVRKGLWLVTGGVVLVTLGTFFNAPIADLLGLTSHAADRVILFAFFWGGMAASFGIIVAVAGVVAGGDREDVRLSPVVGILLLAIILFFSLVGSSFRSQRAPTLRPGESITI